MKAKAPYQTKQKAQVMAYLETIPGRHVTAAQVYEHLKQQDCAIGNTTVYRSLEKLVDEGIVKKYMIDANSPACFEFVGRTFHQGNGNCFHCKCEKCGKLIHLHCEEFQMIASHLQREHQFTLDPLRTVFYGICECCSSDVNGQGAVEKQEKSQLTSGSYK